MERSHSDISAYLYVLIRDRSLSGRKSLGVQVAMPSGAVAAVMHVQRITSSGFRDVRGPVDVMALLSIAVMGVVGAAILVYALQTLIHPPGRQGRRPRT